MSDTADRVQGLTILMGVLVGKWRRWPEQDEGDTLAWMIEASKDNPPAFVRINQLTGEVTIKPMPDYADAIK